MGSAAQRHQIPMRGILYMLITAVILFPALNASVKYLSQDYSLVQIIWMRSVIHFLWMVVLFMPVLGIKLFMTTRLKLQIARSFLQLTALTSFVVGLMYTPMTTAASIYFSGPLIVVALAAPLLGERVGLKRWIAVFIGFIGAVIILRPGGEGMHWASILILVSAALYALYQILTRIVADHDDFRVSSIYTVFVALIISTIAVPFFWVTPVNIVHWTIFIGLGVLGGLGHLFVIKAYEHAEASLVSPFDYGQLIGATILGFFLFSEFPDVWTWVGAGIIMLSGIYVARYKQRIEV